MAYISPRGAAYTILTWIAIIANLTGKFGGLHPGTFKWCTSILEGSCLSNPPSWTQKVKPVSQIHSVHLITVLKEFKTIVNVRFSKALTAV